MSWIDALLEGDVEGAIAIASDPAASTESRLTAEGMEAIVLSDTDGVAVLEALLQAGLLADFVLEDGRTLLTEVVWVFRHALRAQERFMDLGEIQRLLAVLLAAGADINGQDDHGQTVLMMLMEGYPVMYTAQGVELVRWLLSVRAEANLQDRRGRTAVMGLFEGYTNAVGRAPQERGVVVRQQRRRREEVRSAMRELCRLFTDYDHSIEDEEGRTALDFLSPEDREVVERFMQKGGRGRSRGRSRSHSRSHSRGHSRGHSKKTRALSRNGLRSLLERRVSRRARGASRAKRASRKGKGRRTALLSSTR